jgi:hypothetical protein
MKKIKNIFALFLFAELIFVCGCLNGELIWADNSVTQTSGIDVKVLDISRKQFVLGVDDESLVSQFSKFGELVTFNIEISGEIPFDLLKESTTGMITNAQGIPEVSKNQNESDYYADLFKVKIYLPKNAVYVNYLDSRGDILIDKAKMTEDTYLKKNFEFVKLNKAKTEAHLVSNANNGDAYYFIGFSGQNKEPLERYFLHITYKVNIK